MEKDRLFKGIDGEERRQEADCRIKTVYRAPALCLVRTYNRFILKKKEKKISVNVTAVLEAYYFWQLKKLVEEKTTEIIHA